MTTRRQAGPLDMGGVLLLHLVVLAAMTMTRVEPATLHAAAPIMASIIRAPSAAPTESKPHRKVAPPLAMRSQPRRQTPPAKPMPRTRDATVRPLTSTSNRTARETVAVAPQSTELRPPSPRPAPAIAAPRRTHAKPAPNDPPADARAEPLARVSVASTPASTLAPDATAPTAAAERTPGTMASPNDNRAYFGALLQQLNRYKVYPAALRKAKIEGRVVLKFTIDAQGRVTGSAVQRASGHAALDDAAARMLARASPLPAIPPSMGKTSLTLSVPIEYSLLTDR